VPELAAETAALRGGRKLGPCANRSIILRGVTFALCCAHGLAARTSVADCRDDGGIVPLEQCAAEEIYVREKHALRLRFSSVKRPRTCPVDSIPSEERRTTHDRGEESITHCLQACFALRIAIVKRV
jgi:hypothetical protein